MTSLSVRLAGLLVAAIVAVVVAAAFVTFQIVDRPRDRSFERSFAEEVLLLSRLIDGSPERARAAGVALGPEPEEVGDEDWPARRIGRALRRMGEDVPVRVVSPAEGERRLAFPVTAQEWAYLIYPSPPPSPLPALTAYLLLVVAGAVAVALYVAVKITGPARMLERAMGSMRADGTLEPVPETGPAEVRATARALNALSARLRTALESRMRLVAAAGHDLRTPMTRMRLRAEFLPDEDRETWLRDLEELDRIADSAIRLVREEVADDAFEAVELAPFLEEITAELCEIGLPAEFTALSNPCVKAQPLALKRALRNLLENAATHGKGARATLTQAQGAALLTIEDDGPGIPPDLIERVFEPFFRVDPGRRKLGPGAGLGLAIAGEIVERHGGSIAIANREGGGLSQEVRLPLA
ncbi:ATP-binding protein [Aureimonas populi]|uniref:histidine kinase n=1 Tax=Aureimonas populi TaxID=1701758 RepID=A0ABW5CMB4_9HYPH|nr:ATP-binding protein [Aureimonas populi]